jgi:hypothetical protein
VGKDGVPSADLRSSCADVLVVVERGRGERSRFLAPEGALGY